MSKHCLWILLYGEELALSYVDFPWFKVATIEQALNMRRPANDHLYWSDLGVDLSVESIRNPGLFPLKTKSSLI